MSSIRNTRLLFLGAACLGALAACGGSDPVSSGSDAAPAAQLACDAYTGPAPDSLLRLRGGIHAHSSYSDGDIHSIPANYYANAAANGLDFFAGTEHSDTYDPNIFVSTGGDCFTTPDNLLTCLTPNDDKLRKWAATAEQATAATTPVFTPLRGFEWTSDRFGHINVLFSADITNAKIDGGYVDMASFYDWLTRDPAVPVLGGASDGIAIFNHPNDKKLSDSDPGRNWNLLAHVDAADTQMVGMELFNSGALDDDPDGGRHDYYADWYMTALDNGWHVGAVGGEDMHDTTWTLPTHPKTIIYAADRQPATLKQAMLDRRMFAQVSREPGEDIDIRMQAEGHPMGSRLSCDPGKTVPLTVNVMSATGGKFSGTLRLYDHADPAAPLAATTGTPLATAQGDTLRYDLPVKGDGEHWFFIRVDNAKGESLAYTSPVWIGPRAPATP